MHRLRYLIAGTESIFRYFTRPAWDGTTNGRECPTADYYYVIDLGNGQTYNGVVTSKSNMIKKLVFTFIISRLGYGLNAQQLPMYSHLIGMTLQLILAYTGLTGSPRIQLGYRNQWSGFEGARTFTLGGHTLLEKQNIGLGGMLFLDDVEEH